MRVLVTGAGGLLGSKLVEVLCAKGHEVYSGYLEHLPPKGLPLKFDVSNEDEVERAFGASRPEAVVHLAALTDVDRCEVEKELAWRMNVTGTGNVARLCRRYGALLIYASTDYVFKGDRGMYREEDEPDPVNYYGHTKLKGEEEVKTMVGEYCICRASVIYGSTPAAGKTNFALWIMERLREGIRIRVATDQWISPTLNTNLSMMIAEALEKRLTGVYHMAGATRVTRFEMAKAIAEAFQLEGPLIEPVKMEELSWKARRPRDSSLDVSKARGALENMPLELGYALKLLKAEMASPVKS